MGKTECVGVGEREREGEILRVRGTKGAREGRVRVRSESERESEREHETVREVENFGSWRYAV